MHVYIRAVKQYIAIQYSIFANNNNNNNNNILGDASNIYCNTIKYNILQSPFIISKKIEKCSHY